MKSFSKLLAVTFVCLITFVGTEAKSRVETVQFQSKIIKTPLPYNVILPLDYESATATRYPVLYLLHGLTGHYSDKPRNN